MKKVLKPLLMLSFLTAISLFSPLNSAMALSGRLIPFQARLTNAEGNPLHGVFPVVFVLYNAATGSEDNQHLWREVHTTASILAGQLNVILGTITSLDAIDFDQTLYLGITVGSESNQEMVPRHRLIPSFHAKTANEASHAMEATHAIGADFADRAALAEDSQRLGSIVAAGYVTKTELDSSFDSVRSLDSRVHTIENATVPPGGILPFAGQTPPPGFLICDGSAYPVADYPALHEAIGFMYGFANAHQSFKVPDYRGFFLRGTSRGSGADPEAASRTDRGDGTGGDAVGTRQSDNVRSHNHHDGSRYQNLVQISRGGGPETATNTDSTNGEMDILTAKPIIPYGGAETRPQNVSVLYIIKY